MPKDSCVIDTLPWQVVLSIVPLLDKSDNENVQNLVSDIAIKLHTKLFKEAPIAEAETENSNTLAIAPSPQKPN